MASAESAFCIAQRTFRELGVYRHSFAASAGIKKWRIGQAVYWWLRNSAQPQAQSDRYGGGRLPDQAPQHPGLCHMSRFLLIRHGQLGRSHRRLRSARPSPNAFLRRSHRRRLHGERHHLSSRWRIEVVDYRRSGRPHGKTIPRRPPDEFVSQPLKTGSDADVFALQAALRWLSQSPPA